jgi:hypothetical protein
MRFLKERKLTILIAGSGLALVILQLAYVKFVRLFPDLVKDEIGIANSLAKHIFDAQEKYRAQNGVFAQNLRTLESGKFTSKEYAIGYSDDFSPTVGKLCGDCKYYEQGYKIILLLKRSRGAVVWSLNDKRTLTRLGVIDDVSFDTNDKTK